MDKSLDLEDYLNAAGDSAQRSRTVTFVLVIASVLALACLLNSLQSNWMRQRISAIEKADSEYSRTMLGLDKTTPLTAEHMTHHEALYKAVVESYISNTFVVRVPLLGITFDINDLGLIGGLSLLVLLIWLRFAILREMDNLKIAFEEAKRQQEMNEMYHLLAMRQVLTMPPMEGGSTGWLGRLLPKALMILPAIVMTMIFIHDLMTLDIGRAVSDRHVLLNLLGSVVCLALVIVVTIYSVLASFEIDEIWRRYWKELKSAPVVSIVRGPSSFGGAETSTP